MTQLTRVQQLLAAQKSAKPPESAQPKPPVTPPTVPTPPTASASILAAVRKRQEALAAKSASLATSALPNSTQTGKAALATATAATLAAKLRVQAALQARAALPAKEVELVLPTRVQEDKSVPAPVEGTLLPASAPRSKHEITAQDLNPKQALAVSLAEQHKSFVLIGSAGSGKTTTTRIIAEVLHASGKISNIRATNETKYLLSGKPAVAIVSFTNQAVTNIKEAMPSEYKSQCFTAHKLLEFKPVYFELEDEEGSFRKTMRYVPTRDAMNPIPQLDVIIVEEAGNVGIDLYDLVDAATPDSKIEILLGDLNQLPPVFGDAILGYKLLEYPVVELSHIYRQESDSPIKKFTYALLEGRPLSDAKVQQFEVPKELEFKPFKLRKEPDAALVDAGNYVRTLTESYFQHEKAGTTPENPLDVFNYEEDVILIPYGKGFGATELAKHIAQAVSTALESPTFEIIAGFTKLYYAVGDIVYWDKNKWRIVDIIKNADYIGKSPQPASTKLDRWGVHADLKEQLALIAEQKQEDLEAQFELIAKLSMDAQNDTAFHQASHSIILESIGDLERGNAEVSRTGDIAKMYFAYALTVHKSLGSEWNKVFCIFHHSHSTMIQRELLYTACTRARKYMRVHYSGEHRAKPNDSVFQKGILSQRIPGNNLEAKLKYFKDKLLAEALKAETRKAQAEGRSPDVGTVLNRPIPELAAEMLQVIRDKKNPLGAPKSDSDDEEAF